MAPALRKGKSVSSVVAGIIRGALEDAETALSGSWPPPDEAIHEARKRLKKARAGLRMLRGGLAVRDFRRQNGAMRDAARRLTRVRDSRILLNVLDTLDRGRAASVREPLARMRAHLEAHRTRTRRKAAGSQKELRPLLRQLHAVRIHLEVPDGSRGWDSIGPGVRRVYRDGRRAAVLAARTPTDEGLHEWRKQAKYLWHALEILGPIRPREVRALVRHAHDLSDCLGDDHDLALLRTTAGSPGLLSAAALKSVDAMIATRRKRLQARAKTLGRRVYRMKPEEFEARLHGYWRARRSTVG